MSFIFSKIFVRLYLVKMNKHLYSDLDSPRKWESGGKYISLFGKTLL